MFWRLIVYSTAEVWGIALLAIAVGAAIGYLLQRQLHAAPRRNREVEQQLHALQDQHKNYRYDVNAHFNRTAELLGQLAESYREVHNHLARGALDLCDPGAVKLLKLLPEQTPVLEEQRATVIEPPRDYALKSPYDKSVLDEDFGLEKARGHHAPEPPRY
jgi:uncharacterized membrane-anchored protein YhcB (DUF1043 family)